MDKTTSQEDPHGLEFVDALVLVSNVITLYICSNPEQHRKTVGDWVLSTFYPEVDPADVTIDRDFRGAVRTSDAETYLTAFLWKGRLDPKPLQKAVRSLL